jgi:serine/threonine protein kinase
MAEETPVPERVIGRYALYGTIASGGMAAVHLGRLRGSVGFSRTVAIKRLHPQFATDRDFVSMFLDEARLCARIRHPNVVPTLDVVADDGQLILVMEYVQGESLAQLVRAATTRHERIPLRVSIAIQGGLLQGLHAAHEATDERGGPLGIVHRDVSPQNVLVGTDGIARVLDFGIAKARGRIHTTSDGSLRGKIAYMAPEQLRRGEVDRRTDVFAASVVLWELLTANRLFQADSEGGVVEKVLFTGIAAPSTVVPGLPPELDRIVLRGLARDPSERFPTAREMALALENAAPAATPVQVGEWVESIAADTLAGRAARIQEVESSSGLTGVSRVRDAITELTGYGAADATKTLPGAAPRSDEASPTGDSIELLSKAHLPVSKSGIERSPKGSLGAKISAAALGLLMVALTVVVVHGKWTTRVASSPATSASGSPSAVGAHASGQPPALDSATPLSPSATVSPSALEMPPAAASLASDAGARPPPPSNVSPGRQKPSANCRDPYTRDALGRKIYKLECLD